MCKRVFVSSQEGKVRLPGSYCLCILRTQNYSCGQLRGHSRYSPSGIPFIHELTNLLEKGVHISLVNTTSTTARPSP